MADGWVQETPDLDLRRIASANMSQYICARIMRTLWKTASRWFWAAIEQVHLTSYSILYSRYIDVNSTYAPGVIIGELKGIIRINNEQNFGISLISDEQVSREN